MDLSITAILALVGVAFFAGLVSSIVGSGGLLTLPALLWAGLPPLSALATNKLQSAMGTLSSVTNFRRHGYLQIAPLVPSLMAAFCGSVLGTLCVLRLSNELMMRAIPLLLGLLGGYFLCAPKMDGRDYPARLSNAQFAATAAFGIGFYGGFFGPASGSILPYLLVFLLGHNLVSATAESKLFILVINCYQTCARFGGRSRRLGQLASPWPRSLRLLSRTQRSPRRGCGTTRCQCLARRRSVWWLVLSPTSHAAPGASIARRSSTVTACHSNPGATHHAYQAV